MKKFLGLLTMSLIVFMFSCGDNKNVSVNGNCENVTCSDHGTCKKADGVAECKCDNGYHSDGLSCIKEGLNITAKMVLGSWLGSDFKTITNTCEIPDRKINPIAFKFTEKVSPLVNYLHCAVGDVNSCSDKPSGVAEISSSFEFDVTNEPWDGNKEGYDCIITMSEKIKIDMESENKAYLTQTISSSPSGSECEAYHDKLVQGLATDPDKYLSNFVKENGCKAKFSFTINKVK